jgi:uncharacterized RDD family membrane protein YckC
MNNNQDIEYAGFWIRFLASLIDTLLTLAITLPLLYAVYGADYFDIDMEQSSPRGVVDFLLSVVFPIVAVLVFWFYRSATPGKMVFSIIIVDARTYQKPSTAQFIGRYFAYILSSLPLCLGFLWVAFDKRKQGWHDKLAKTVVIYRKTAQAGSTVNLNK